MADDLDSDHQTMPSTSGVLTGTLNDEGFLRNVNDAWFITLGWTAAELSNIYFTEFLHPDDIDATSEALRIESSSTGIAGFTNRLIGRDGVHRWFEWNFSPIDDGTHLVGRELTSRTDLRGGFDLRNRALIDISAIGIITISNQGTITGINPVSEKIFGYDPGEMIGENLERYFETSDPKVMDRSQQLEGRHKDGTPFPLSLAMGEITVGGQPAAVCAIEDLTEKLASQAQRQSTMVARHAELVTRQANLAAEAAGTNKNRFMSRMSHELRTPLTAILGFAQLSELEAETDDQREIATTITNAGRHLLTLINDVLDVSLIETGQLKISVEAVSVSEVVRDCISYVEPQATRSRLRLVDNTGPEEEFVQADRQRIRQVMLSLLSNAVKHSPASEQISIETTQIDARKSRISVVDHGAGVHPDAVARIFEPFQWFDNKSDGAAGTGMGLALSAALTTAMGGTIGVDPTEGGGATFWVELTTSAALVNPTLQLSRGDRTSMPGATNTLLYIEDNAPNVRLIERVLERRDSTELLVAATGTEGLELAELRQPDFIFLDLHLPDLRGEKVLVHLQSNPVTRDIPVVIISADAGPDTIERLKGAGVYEFLTKPIDVNQVLSILDDLAAAAGASD